MGQNLQGLLRQVVGRVHRGEGVGEAQVEIRNPVRNFRSRRRNFLQSRSGETDVSEQDVKLSEVSEKVVGVDGDELGLGRDASGCVVQVGQSWREVSAQAVAAAPAEKRFKAVVLGL